MSSAATVPAASRVGRRGQVAAWALWDWGSASFNAVMVTFVFGTYLASDAFGPDERGTAWLSTATALAGVVIALTAPAMGRRADGTGRRRLWLGLTTGAVIACTAACFWVTPEESSLLLGVSLIALGTVFFEFAEVHVNAILVQISTPATIGRVSGVGWGAGYLGGIVLLLLVYVGFVSGDAHWFGVTEQDALNIRVVALVAAAWFLVFAIPVLVAVPEPPAARAEDGHQRAESFLEAYRGLGRTLARLWREDRDTLRFLVASAVFRDGVGAVFVYGAILGTTVFGIDAGDVILFAIVANVVAALGAFVGGRLDDALGPRRVILGSLGALVLTCLVLWVASGPAAFWAGGLVLCLFVGPVQSASRAFLGRATPVERAGEVFGLYATTGRAVGFITPALVSAALALVPDNRVVIPVIAGVLVVGGALLVRVPEPRQAR
ncbi:MFS transporter [Micrococcus sp.]|uniref:MFS transporter n=1 Tax=Micrococcus sp. TaxID=1271 RepID=UPI002A914AB0|nr:MFS transporter [Micrococcus sp.]MDY6054891.1 MFS transporter [Micrococcus sp.]